MRKILRTGTCAAALAFALPALAAEGGSPIVLVVDSRRFSGWLAWWTGIYNESHFLFALLTILIVPTLALVMGKLTGVILSKMGIDLKSRVLAEH